MFVTAGKGTSQRRGTTRDSGERRELIKLGTWRGRMGWNLEHEWE